MSSTGNTGTFLRREPEGDQPGLSILVCPHCGFDYNHPQFPEVLDGNDNYDSLTGFRGDAVRIRVACENGHHWVLWMAQHKGHVYVWAGGEAR